LVTYECILECEGTKKEKKNAKDEKKKTWPPKPLDMMLTTNKEIISKN
jgi:hypothetical protein